MAYTRLLLKKFLKSKFTMVAFGMSLLIIVGCFLINVYNKNQATIEDSVNGQIATDVSSIRNREPGSLAEKDLQMNRKTKQLLESKKLQPMYQSYIDYIDWSLSASKDSPNPDLQLAYFLMSEKARANFLKKVNLPEQSRDYPTTGISFWLYIEQVISPILVPLLLILVCSQLYTKRFSNKIDKDYLIPLTTSSQIFQNLGSGFIISISLILFMFAISFSISTIFFGIGSLDYPAAFYTLKLPFNIYIEQGNLILPVVILRVLSSFFIVSMVYFTALVIKNILSNILFNVVFLIGLNQITEYNSFLKKIAQYLPTSYFNSSSIASGQFSFETRNVHLELEQGVWTLFLSIVTLIVVIYFFQKLQYRRMKY